MNSQEQSLPEITVKAFILGVVLSMILGAANAYLGLFAGLTVSASIPSAVVSMAVLRLFKRSNILENNIVQTAASSGEAIAAGVIFTLPALLIVGFWKEFSYLWVTLIAVFAGLLGDLFTIPLRRSLIVDAELQYPEGIATAEVLKAGEGAGSGVWHLAKAGAAGAIFKLLGGEFIGLWPEKLQVSVFLGRTLGYFGTYLSPALLSVGYIVGLNIAVLVFLGGAANALVAIPICALTGECPEGMTAIQWAGQIWREQTRYIGVGAMLVGGLWTIFQMRTSLARGIASGLAAYRRQQSQFGDIPRTEKDLPMKWVLIMIALSVVPLFLVYQVFVQRVVISATMAVLMLVLGFIFAAVAAYMAGIVGSSNNPISGVTVSTVVVSSLLLLLLMGKGAKDGAAAAIAIGSVVCCAAAASGDVLQDLKAGRLIGATPWKQQLMEIVGSTAGALVVAPVLMLLQQAYGFAGMPGAGDKALVAPQANLMAAVARGVFEADLPWGFILIGAAVAIAIVAMDVCLERRKSSFRTPVLAVAIGIYLPFELSVPIFVGGLIHFAVRRYLSKRSATPEVMEESGRNGILFASGLITGEALMGIVVAIPIVALKQMNVELPLLAMPGGAFLGTLLLLGVIWWLYRTALPKKSQVTS